MTNNQEILDLFNHPDFFAGSQELRMRIAEKEKTLENFTKHTSHATGGKLTDDRIAALRDVIGKSKENIKQKFHLGELSLGFPGKLEWEEANEILTGLPESYKTVTEHITSVQGQITKNNTRIRDIDAEIQALQQEKTQLLEAVSDLSDSVEKDTALSVSISAVRHFAPSVAKPVLEVESELASAVATQLKNDPEDFGSLYSDDGRLPLALVLNSAKMSPEVIKELADLDSFDFFSPGLDSTLKFYGIDFATRKDLCYLSHMMQRNQHPSYDDHKVKCVVCSSDNGEAISYLLEEHDLDALPTDFAAQMNGPHLLGTDIQDLVNEFQLDTRTAKSVMKSIRYLRKLHQNALKDK